VGLGLKVDGENTIISGFRDGDGDGDDRGGAGR